MMSDVGKNVFKFFLLVELYALAACVSLLVSQIAVWYVMLVPFLLFLLCHVSLIFARVRTFALDFLFIPISFLVAVWSFYETFAWIMLSIAFWNIIFDGVLAVLIHLSVAGVSGVLLLSFLNRFHNKLHPPRLPKATRQSKPNQATVVVGTTVYIVSVFMMTVGFVGIKLLIGDPRMRIDEAMFVPLLVMAALFTLGVFLSTFIPIKVLKIFESSAKNDDTGSAASEVVEKEQEPQSDTISIKEQEPQAE